MTDIVFALGLLALFAAAMAWLARNPAGRVLEARALDELARVDAEVGAQRELAQAEIDARHAANVAAHNRAAAQHAAELELAEHDTERLRRAGVLPSAGLLVSPDGNRKQRLGARAEARRGNRKRVGRDVTR